MKDKCYVYFFYIPNKNILVTWTSWNLEDQGPKHVDECTIVHFNFVIVVILTQVSFSGLNHRRNNKLIRNDCDGILTTVVSIISVPTQEVHYNIREYRSKQSLPDRQWRILVICPVVSILPLSEAETLRFGFTEWVCIARWINNKSTLWFCIGMELIFLHDFSFAHLKRIRPIFCYFFSRSFVYNKSV